MCYTQSTATIAIVITKSAAGVNRAVQQEEELCWEKGKGGDRSAISINDPPHGPSCSAHGDPKRAALVLPHYLQISHLGYQPRIEDRVASASVDRLRFCALAQHTNPSRSGSIQATGDRCAILRLRLSRQLSLPNPQLKRLTLTRCQRSVSIASRSKIVRSYDRCFSAAEVAAQKQASSCFGVGRHFQ